MPNPFRRSPATIFVGLFSSLLFVTFHPAWSQAPGVQIESASPLNKERDWIRQALALRDAGKLLKPAEVTKLLRTPQPDVERLTLPEPQTKPLATREIFQRAQAAYVRIGWLGRFPDSKTSELDLAGGYAISADGAVVTCHHCLLPREEMKSGGLVAVTSDNRVLPVTAILAVHKKLDAAIVRVAGKFQPLPLQDQIFPGDTVYVYSDPFNVRGYFSSGIVNRFFWLAGKPGDPATLPGAAKMRVHVSTDWAPGSSGSAVLDVCGNAIGHAAVIETLGDDAEEPPVKEVAKESPPAEKTEELPLAKTPVYQQMLTLHEAVPARGVKLLAKLPASPPKAKAKTAAKAE